MRGKWVALGMVLVWLGAAGSARGAEPLRWGTLHVVCPSPADSLAFIEALDLEGRPVAEAPLGPAIHRGLDALAERGHPFAEARPGGFGLEDGRLVGRIHLDPGVKAHLEGLELPGAEVTSISTALRLAGVTRGEVYTGDADRRVHDRLARSGLFTSVGEPVLEPGLAPDAVRLKVPVTEPPYTRFSGILGVSGRNSRLTGLVDLDLANIGGTARHAAGRWENRGNGLTRYNLSYHEPWLPLIPVGVEGNLAHDVNEGVYSHTTWEVNGVLQWAGMWTFRLGRGGSRAVEAGTAAGDVTEGFTLAGIELDRRNSVLVPTAGYRLGLTSRRGTKRFTPAGDSLQVRVDRTRWNAEGEGYRRFGRRWMAALTANFHYLETPEDSLPRYDLFAVGGAASLRGYREEQFLTPGVVILQAEWRWLQDDRGSALYLFDDVAFISPRTGRSLRDTFHTFLMGTGVGVRQASRLGILGVEYGVAKGENPLDGRIHFRVDAVF
jgi:outer membrane protein assembly factor BamA